MDSFEHIQEAPDLSGQVVVLDGKPIFTGSYSCVYKGELREDGQLVAIKVINAVRGSALHTMRRKLLRERTAWGALDHPNILPLYGFADDNKLFEPFGALISPWMQQGDAVDFLAENQDLLTDEDKVGLWRDVVEGVNYLHSFNPQLVHGDLKPRNVLIDDSCHARICDFGLVRVYLEGGSSGFTTTTNHTGTERYLAYELVIAAEDACPTVASDVWAVGCVGLEFIFSQPPYSARKGNYGGAIYADIRAGIPPATRPDDIAHHLDSLWIYLELCWDPDPDERPSAAALSVWLQGLLEHSSKPVEEHSLIGVQTNNEEQVIRESLEADSKVPPFASEDTAVDLTNLDKSLPLSPDVEFHMPSSRRGRSSSKAENLLARVISYESEDEGGPKIVSPLVDRSDSDALALSGHPEPEPNTNKYPDKALPSAPDIGPPMLSPHRDHSPSKAENPLNITTPCDLGDESNRMIVPPLPYHSGSEESDMRRWHPGAAKATVQPVAFPSIGRHLRPPSPSWSSAATSGGDRIPAQPPLRTLGDVTNQTRASPSLPWKNIYLPFVSRKSNKLQLPINDSASTATLTSWTSAATKLHFTEDTESYDLVYAPFVDTYIEEPIEIVDTGPRLMELRKKMSEEGVDYFVIPSEDGHLSDHIAPSDQRLRWISNFSGSVGSAIVSKNSAYLFVDSRYWIQAERELDSNWIVCRAGTTQIKGWLEWTIKCSRGSRIAIDSRMIRHERATKLYKGLYDRGSKLLHPRQNLIDLIWEDRPKRPNDPISLHSVQYTGKTAKEKLSEIRKWIRKMDVAYQPNTNAPSIKRNASSNKIAAIFISDMRSIAYTLNLYGNDVPFHSVFMAYLVVGVGGITTLFVQMERISKIKGVLSEDGISVREYGEIWTYLRSKQWGDGKIIIHLNTPYAVSLIVGSHSYVILPSFIDEMRALKNEVEIEGLRNSYIRDGVAIVRWFAWLESKLLEGYEITEFEASEKLDNFRRGDKAQRYLGPGSANIVASGSNTAIPLYNPTRLEASLISRNSPFLVDIKSRYLDGMCTVARTTHFGSPTTEQAESFVHVLQGHLAVDTAAFPPGTTCAQLGVLASKTLWRDGQNHHSFLSFHEPSDSLTLSTPLQPGHVIINEPGFYKDGEFGIRLGSAFVVRRVRGAIGNGLYGLERLTQVPIQTKMIRWSMLSKEEQQWIKDHNANVLKVLEPHLLEDKRALKWLRRECRIGLVGAIKGFAKLAID